MENNFNDEDIKQYTAALNFIAKEAKFGEGEPKIMYMIEARNHFAFLQGLLKKIEANILEVKKLHKPKEDKKSK